MDIVLGTIWAIFQIGFWLIVLFAFCLGCSACCVFLARLIDGDISFPVSPAKQARDQIQQIEMDTRRKIDEVSQEHLQNAYKQIRR